MAAIIAAMYMKIRPFSLAGALLCALMAAAPLAAQQPERPVLAISAYTIDAEIDTATHHLTAKAVVTFTAPDNAEIVASAFTPRSRSPKSPTMPAKSSPASAPPTAPSA